MKEEIGGNECCLCFDWGEGGEGGEDSFKKWEVEKAE